MDKIIGIKPNQAPSNADLGTIAYQDAEYLSVENLKVGSGNLGNTPSAWVTIVKDNDNSGNQLVLADSEGQSPAIRTYSIPGTGGDPAGLILNHYYAQSGSGNQYMRYADFVANVGNGAGTTMRFITKNASNTFSTGLQINQDGNVGIGTTSPSVELDIKRHTNAYPLRVGSEGGQGRAIAFADVAATPTKYNWIAGTQYNVDNGFEITPSTAVGGYTFNSPALVIKQSGNVGIGTSSPAANLDVIDPVSGNFDGKIHIGGNGSNRRLILEQTDVLTYTIGGTGTNSVTRFVSGGSAGTGTEAMRIDSAGTIQTKSSDGLAPSIGTGCVSIWGRSNSSSVGILRVYKTGDDGNIVDFYRTGNSLVGSIGIGVNGTTYNTTSDIKLKENIEPISDGKEKLMLMKASTFNFIADKEKQKMHGFVAQEMKEIIPEAVTGDDILNMDYGRITPILVAALQDAFREIEELRNKLENK